MPENENESLKNENESLKLTKVSMGKIIDGFVMLHYVIKNIHDAETYEEILKRYLESLTSKLGFGFDNAELYIFEEGKDKVTSVKLFENILKYERGKNNWKNKIIEEAIEEKNHKIFDNSKKVIIPLESQNDIIGIILIENSIEISFEVLKALEIFGMQTSTILDLVKLKSNLEKEIHKQTLTLEEVNNQLKEYNENLEEIVKKRTKKLKNVQTQMIQKEKLASIGKLAAGVAHELNNPIGFVLGNFSALKNYFQGIKEYIKLNEKFREELESKEELDLKENLDKLNRYKEENEMDFILEDIEMLFEESEDGINRVINIVKNLKEFSRIDNEKSENYDLNKGIVNTLTIAKNEYKYVADIELDLNDENPLIKANGSEINEVILNIIVNAAQAIAELGVSEKKIIKIKTYQESNYVCCEISDNGPGIPQKIINKIFDPFFTTKEPGKGTGLGLNIAYDIIVNKHSGELQVESKLKEGTKFFMKLPIE